MNPIRSEKIVFAVRLAIIALFLTTAFVIGTVWGWSQEPGPPPEPGIDLCWFGTNGMRVCHRKNGYCTATIWDLEGLREVKCRFGERICIDNGWVALESDGWCRIKPKCKHKGGSCE